MKYATYEEAGEVFDAVREVEGSELLSGMERQVVAEKIANERGLTLDQRNVT